MGKMCKCHLFFHDPPQPALLVVLRPVAKVAPHHHLAGRAAVAQDGKGLFFKKIIFLKTFLCKTNVLFVNRVVPALGQPEILVDLPREPLPAQLAVQTKGVHEGTAQFNNMSYGTKKIKKKN